MNILLLSQNLSSGASYSETMSGGMLADGAVAIKVVAAPVLIAAGVYLAGQSFALPQYSPAASGGCWANGTAQSASVSNPVTSGGILAAGSGIAGAQTYNQIVTPAGLFAAGAATISKVVPVTPSGGGLAGSSASVTATYSVVTAQGVYLSGTFPENTPPSPPPPPRVLPYPVITFRVNLDMTGTQGTPCDTSDANRQYLLNLARLSIPGVGEVKHGDVFTLYGIEADYVKRWYTKVGRLPYDPQNTLEVIDIS